MIALIIAGVILVVIVAALLWFVGVVIAGVNAVMRGELEPDDEPCELDT